MDDITARILGEIGCEDLLERLTTLPPSDLHALMLAVYRQESQAVDTASLMRAQAANRYVAPAETDPIAHLRLEADLLELAKGMGIVPRLLSPVSPLGSCSAFGFVSQDKVVSAARGLEVLSDPSNALALLMALERKRGGVARAHHFCAAARTLRAQAFSGKRSFAHFGLFTIVSGGRDSGNFGCEAGLFAAQLRFYAALAGHILRRPLQVVLRWRGGYADGFLERMADICRETLPDADVSLDSQRDDNAYYRGLNFKLMVPFGDELIELGDGGFVDWTQRLMNNRKERCLISGIGIDRLLTLTSENSC